MPKPVSSLRNLGPATEAAFARAGIHSAGDLAALGADAAYSRLLDTGEPPHFIGYYALVMALQGRPWNDCHGAEKTALRARFDALKRASRSTAGIPAGLRSTMNEIGLHPPHSPSPHSQSPGKNTLAEGGTPATRARPD